MVTGEQAGMESGRNIPVVRVTNSLTGIANGYTLKMKSCVEIIPNLIKYTFIAIGTKCIIGGDVPYHTVSSTYVVYHN